MDSGVERKELLVHATTRGFSHVRKGIVCEDASGSARLRGVNGLAFAVADGHGDPACSRSALGSSMAIEAALGCLGAFAGELAERVPKESELARLGEDVVRAWRERVLADFERHPLGEEERSGLGERGRQLADRRPEHLYGTTLLAGLLLPQALVLIQQGDGCCVLIDEQGEASCPIPEDERCVANVTTSLCDADAAERMRCVALDCAETKPVACFVGTDGIDKSLSGEDGAIDYCMELAFELVEMQDENSAVRYVEGQIDELGEQGSGDDASLAGFVDVVAVKALEPVLRLRLERRTLADEAAKVREKLTSMERLHDRYLHVEPEGEEETERRERFLAEYDALERRLRELEAGSCPVDAGRADEPPTVEVPDDVQVAPVPDAVDDESTEESERLESPKGRRPPEAGRDTGVLSPVRDAHARGAGPALDVAESSGPRGRRDLVVVLSIVLSVVSIALVALLLVIVLGGGDSQSATRGEQARSSDVAAQQEGLGDVDDATDASNDVPDVGADDAGSQEAVGMGEPKKV